MILEKVTVNKKLVAEDLILIWERSIKKTHSHLKEENIAKLKPLVKLAIKNMQTILIAKEKNNIVGFIALENKKIEMLASEFLDVQKALLLFAIKNYGAMWVDVNEQNNKEIEFYENMGFRIFSCSKTFKTDDTLLHMKWEQK